MDEKFNFKIDYSKLVNQIEDELVVGLLKSILSINDKETQKIIEAFCKACFDNGIHGPTLIKILSDTGNYLDKDTKKQ